MYRHLIALCVLTLLASHASALDTVFMKNGDRITGEISQIWDGEVYIEPSYADEFAIDLADVDHIEGESELDFDLTDRSEYTARLTVDEIGRQVLQTNSELFPVRLTDIDIAEEPIEGNEFEASSDVAMNVSSGNAETASFYSSAAVMARRGRHRNTARLSIDRQEDSGTPIKDQFDVGYRYNWLFRDDWFLEAGAAFRSDPVRDLDRRMLVGAGVGHDVFRQSWRQFRVAAGPTLVAERIGGEDEESLAFNWTHSYERSLFGGDAEVFHRMQILSYLVGRSNHVFDTSTGITYDFLDDFYVKLQLDVNYETDPSAGNENEDITYKIGVGYEY